MFNHPNWSYLFPEEIYRTLPLMIQAYREDRVYQKKIWKPVKKKTLEWRKQYAEIRNGSDLLPILSFQDGREFIIIRQKRFQAAPATHRLVGVSRLIYLFCQKHRPLKKSQLIESPGIFFMGQEEGVFLYIISCNLSSNQAGCICASIRNVFLL